MTTRTHLLTTVAAIVLATGGLAFQPPAFADEARGTAEVPVNIVRPAADLAGALDERGPETVQINLETVEVTGALEDGTTYNYWTFK